MVYFILFFFKLSLSCGKLGLKSLSVQTVQTFLKKAPRRAKLRGRGEEGKVFETQLKGEMLV